MTVGGTSGGCAAGIDVGAPVVLQSADPQLLSNAGSLVFSFSTSQACADLMDLGPAQIAERLRDERAPLQVVTDLRKTGHVFGVVAPDVPIAYFVLASSKRPTSPLLELGEFSGSVFAMGCSDLEAVAGKRHDLPVQMFPVGLR